MARKGGIDIVGPVLRFIKYLCKIEHSFFYKKPVKIGWSSNVLMFVFKKWFCQPLNLPQEQLQEYCDLSLQIFLRFWTNMRLRLLIDIDLIKKRVFSWLNSPTKKTDTGVAECLFFQIINVLYMDILWINIVYCPV